LISTRCCAAYDRIGDAGAWRFVLGYPVANNVGPLMVGPVMLDTCIFISKGHYTLPPGAQTSRRKCIPGRSYDGWWASGHAHAHHSNMAASHAAFAFLRQLGTCATWSQESGNANARR
jgi:hypothetical protein